MTKQVFHLVHDEARRRAISAVQSAPDGYVVKVSEPVRSLDQNAAQWPILEAFAKQKKWHCNGAMVGFTEDDWKDVLTATFKGEQVRISQTLDGRMLALGIKTSKLPKSEFSQYLDWLHATAIQYGVTVYKDEAT